MQGAKATTIWFIAALPKSPRNKTNNITKLARIKDGVWYGGRLPSCWLRIRECAPLRYHWLYSRVMKSVVNRPPEKKCDQGSFCPAGLNFTQDYHEPKLGLPCAQKKKSKHLNWMLNRDERGCCFCCCCRPPVSQPRHGTTRQAQAKDLRGTGTKKRALTGSVHGFCPFLFLFLFLFTCILVQYTIGLLMIFFLLEISNY
jgi:hypothetical protein